ncbi:hypothetical protein [uncultured Ruegeria sp.]|uniref:hypothetical protein n=2 Tax=uncultured Ruegeria sp. TaxID=259304 RepID=UPI002614EDE2|nr:hypothetical protein [uncultured Ruegeria sp.]
MRAGLFVGISRLADGAVQWRLGVMILFVAALSLFTLILIVEDVRWFEISYRALGAVTLNGICLNVLLDVSVIDMLCGAFIWLIASVVVRFACSANALGQGNNWLMGAIGLLAGVNGALAALGVYGILMIATHLSYTRARLRPKGKRIISLFPTALSGGLTILLVFCCRIAGFDISFGTAEEISTDFDLLLLGGVVIFGGPIAVVSVTLGVTWIIFDHHTLQRGCSR